MASSSAAASSSCGRSKRRGAGRGHGQHHPVGVVGSRRWSRSTSGRPGGPDSWRPPRGGCPRRGDAARRPAPPPAPHAAVERPEERRSVGVGCRHLRPQGAHEAAPAPRCGEQRWEHRGGRHVVDRPGVDAPDEGIDQRVGHPRPELARDERADGAVAEWPAHVGSRQQRIAQQSQPAPRAQDAAARGRPDAGGHAEGQALGQGAQPAPGKDRGAPAGDRYQCVTELHVPGEPESLGAATEEAIGPHVHRPPSEGRTAQSTTEAVRGLEEDDGGPLAGRLGATGELPGRAEAADASPDHDDLPLAHVRRPGPPPSRRRPVTAMKAGSSFSDAVRA